MTTDTNTTFEIPGISDDAMMWSLADSSPAESRVSAESVGPVTPAELAKAAESVGPVTPVDTSIPAGLGSDGITVMGHFSCGTTGDNWTSRLDT